MMIEEDRIRLLEEQVMRLTRENKAMAKIYEEKINPFIDLMDSLMNEEVKYVENYGVSYHG